MEVLKSPLKWPEKFFYFCALLFVLPALLIGLGQVNIFLGVDEATRGMVALEMMISNNYLVPTINGELYYNKPPLFNWLLIAFFQLTGSKSEFVMRLPVALSLVGFGALIFAFNRKHLGFFPALLSGFMLITCGRVLFWESFFAYIDITFSAMVYLGFMLIYHYHEQEKYWHLFILSYLVAAVAFMLKGLPGIVFQGITLTVFFAYQRQWKRFFSIPHIVGGLLFLFIVGAYYFAYSQQHSLEDLLYRLWDESAKRTAIEKGIGAAVQDFFVFPLEMFYHYVPWSLLAALFVFRKGFWGVIKEQPYPKFLVFTFLANIILYWTSPDVYPKYILMLVPLVFTLGYYFYLNHPIPWRVKAFDIVCIIGGVAACLACMAFPFLPNMSDQPYAFLVAWGLAIPLGGIAWLMFKRPASRLILLVNAMLLFRIAFSWFIWSQRAPKVEPFRQDAFKVVEIVQDAPLAFLNHETVQFGLSFYLTRERMKIVPKTDQAVPGTYYLTTEAEVKHMDSKAQKFKIWYELPNVEDGSTLYLVTLE